MALGEVTVQGTKTITVEHSQKSASYSIDYVK